MWWDEGVCLGCGCGCVCGGGGKYWKMTLIRKCLRLCGLPRWLNYFSDPIPVLISSTNRCLVAEQLTAYSFVLPPPPYSWQTHVREPSTLFIIHYNVYYFVPLTVFVTC